MQAIVVTFDRLASRLVGCYGNEWIETPNIDRMAATATVFDNYFADSMGADSGRAWLTGHHSLHPARPADRSLGDFLSAAGIQSHLFVDDLCLFNPADETRFDHVVRVSGVNGLEAAPHEVPIARLVQAATSLLKDSRSVDNRLIWIHAPEPGLPPEGFATLYEEDFEERDELLSATPRDEWSKLIAVAAGSVSLVDHWLGELFSQIAAAGPTANGAPVPTLVMVCASRGRSWTENFINATPTARKDTPADHLRDQETRSPLVMSIQGDVRFTEISSLRCQRFVQTTDLLPTLVDWFRLPANSVPGTGRSLLQEAVSEGPARTEIIVADGDRQLGLRTPDWNCLIRLTTRDQAIRADVCYGDTDWPEQVQLFAKPEDIWDVTDLSTQQPEVCEELVRRLAAFRAKRSED
ncbi:MAG: sulfatase-like hydrolase/transferase [Planctomycetes bacterium]|nr:sulfatase-like hydrolase/transferase [Planctomycetota bacterium]